MSFIALPSIALAVVRTGLSVCAVFGLSGILVCGLPLAAAVQDSVPLPVLVPKPAAYGIPIVVGIATVRPLPNGLVYRYTVDGTDPSPTSWRFEGGILVTDPTEVRIRAFMPGLAASATVVGKYQIHFPLVTQRPIYDIRLQANGQALVAIACPTLDASILITTDGTDPTFRGTLYRRPFVIAQSQVENLRARGIGGRIPHQLGRFILWLPALVPSGVAVPQRNQQPAVAIPQLSNIGGRFQLIQSVGATCATAQAVIRYTIDGSDPGEAAAQFPLSLIIDHSLTLKVRGFMDGAPPSPLVTAVYELQVPNPTFTPAPGEYADEQAIAIATATMTDQIRATTDGTDPTTTMPVMNGPLAVAASATVTARAYRAGWSPSASVVGVYALTVATPTLSPAEEYLTAPVQVMPLSLTKQTVFGYTLDGQVPTPASQLVPAAGIPVMATSLITVVGFRDGFTPSAPVVATYHLPYLTWAQRTIAGVEGTPTVVATAHLSEPLPRPYSVAVTSAAGTANDLDYQIPDTGLMFAAGAVDATIAVGITDDAICEGTEQVALVLNPSPGAWMLSEQATCIMSIADNDPRPAVAFVAASQTCSETDGPVALPIHLIGASGLPSMVTMTATGGSAHAGIHYIFEPTTIAFTSFQNAAEAYVTILNTIQAKEDLTVVFTLTGVDGQPIGSPSTCTLQIRSVVPGNPVVTWNDRARAAVAHANTDPAMAARVYALVGVAQRRAVMSLPSSGVSAQGAVLGASLEVLSQLFPDQSADFLVMAQNDLQSDSWGGLTHEAATQVDAFGRQIGSLVVAEAKSDGSAAIWLGTPPVGPSYWFASWPYPQPPLRPLWGQVRPWFLAAGNEFRPAAPPAIDSATYKQALSEVRSISDRRTAEQLAIAGKWVDGPGSSTPAGTWVRIADGLVLDRHLSVAEAAKLSGLLGATLMDASIACWDAKYTYWLIRPYQADRSIITPIGQPNFPAYVSGHATFSGAASEILAHTFPDVAEAMRASAEEAALSRLYGGIHYRFDNDKGLALGRQVAAKALAADAAGAWGSDQSPRIAFVAPAPASILTDRRPTIDVKITDDRAIPVAGIHVALTRDGSATAVPVTTSVSLAIDGFTGHVLIQPTTDLSDGLYIITATSADADGHIATGRLFFGVDPTGAPVVTITSPVEGDLVGMTNPVRLSGHVSKQVAVLTLNSTEIPLAADSSFQIDLPIDPYASIRRPLTMMGGINELYVRAVDAAGLAGGARVTLRVDDHAPTLAVEFPADNAVVADSSTAVIGRAQDLVLGQVTTNKITVTVNGILAVIRNGNFQIAALPLVYGVNDLTVIATDQSGNHSQLVSHVVRQQPTGNSLALVSGAAQEGAPHAVAAQSLSVKALNANGAPIPHQPVTWNVSRGDGRLVESTIDDHRMIVTLTGADGIASVHWELGGNAGVGNQRLTAVAPGVQIPVIFTASVTPSAPIGLFIVDGDQQSGFTGQPLFRSLVVVARDRTGNPVPGAAVDVSIVRGTGTLAVQLTDTPTDSLALVTDVDGFVHVTLRPGSELGPETTAVRFSVHGVTPELSQTLVASVIEGSGNAADTGITGVVLSTEYQPIPGVTIVIEGTTIGAVSDASGRFTIRGAPAGHRHLQVMGTTGNHDAVQYPTIGFEVDLLSGGLIHLPMPIYLPTMDRANEVLAGGDQEVTITIPGSTGAQVVIAPHSTIRADGVRGPVWMFTSPVNAMAIPMPAPGGSAPILVQTLQPSGTRLDPPAKVRWPNTFGLLPGAQVELISFDHDLGQFVGQGTMSVEEGGQYVTSDAGTGLTKAGWNFPDLPPVPVATVTILKKWRLNISGESDVLSGVPFSLGVSDLNGNEVPVPLEWTVTPEVFPQGGGIVGHLKLLKNKESSTGEVNFTVTPDFDIADNTTITFVLHVTPVEPYKRVNTISAERTMKMIKIPNFIAVDGNRDGKLSFTSEDSVTAQNPWRWWINDDGDRPHEDIDPGADVPGKPAAGSNNFVNYQTPIVDGLRDLVDWFPVAVDLSKLKKYYPLSKGYRYQLDAGNISLVQTGKSVDAAFDYLTEKQVTGFGSNLMQSPEFSNVLSGVIDMPWSMLNATNAEVFLAEGNLIGVKAIDLNILDRQGSAVLTQSLPISVSSVKDFYRWVNLRHAVQESESRPTNTSQPSNYADALTNGNMMVMIHGFNVPEESAEAWGAEMFKRFYQSGSRAMFTAVHWAGDYKIGLGLPPINLVGTKVADYHLAVERSFISGAGFAQEVNSLPGKETTLISHSLGVGVVSSAIVDHGLTKYAKYIAMDAAVPLEAFNDDLSFTSEMTPPNWRDDSASGQLKNYPKRLWAANWFELYPPTDARSQLTWRGRFKGIKNFYNFYSPGEEVLQPSTGVEPSIPVAMTGRSSWQLQEWAKGEFSLYGLTNASFESGRHGGWGFNTAKLIPRKGGGAWTPLTIEESLISIPTTEDTIRPLFPLLSLNAVVHVVDVVNGLTDDGLKAQPFFTPFDNQDELAMPVLGQGAALAERNRLLAQAIPATTQPLGSAKMKFEGIDSNFNMQDARNGWPDKKSYPKHQDWFHSDIKDVAYLYVSPTVKEIVTLSNNGFKTP